MRHGSVPDEALFRAVEFAARAHAGQYRKGTKLPYILHPLRVAQILIEAESSEPLTLAGLLHDTVEDTSATAGEIEDLFGAEVARLVLSVSEPDRSANWEVRKQHTIASLGIAEEDTLLLACADKLDNVRSMSRGLSRVGPQFWGRFHRPRTDQAWYYRSVAAAIEGRASAEPLSGLATTLCREVDQLFGAAADRE